MTKLDYIAESLADSLENHGISLGGRVITSIANDLMTSFDCMDMAFPQPSYNPRNEEVTRLKIELDKERNKVVCNACGGEGRIITPGPYHSSDSQCYACHGEGKL